MTERRSATVCIPYPGDCISVNHYRGRTRDGRDYVKPEARSWMESLGWMIKLHHIEDWRLPLTVTCSGVFLNAICRPDLSNLSKCILDAIEDATGINDREMLWRDGTAGYGSLPELTITIEEAEL